METFFGVLVVVFLIIIFFGHWLRPLLSRWIMGRMEDRFRRMAGMPTRKEEKKMRKEAAKKERKGTASAAGRRSASNAGCRNEPIIPKDYPEDVEFVEIKSHSEETVVRSTYDADGNLEDIEVEEQIEDVEYTEIKTKE